MGLAKADEADKLGKKIAETLDGYDNTIVAGALAEATAAWLASNHPDAREPILQAWLGIVRMMINWCDEDAPEP